MGTAQTQTWGERRETVRVNAQLLVRCYDQNHFMVCDGDISLGGARIVFQDAPKDRQMEVLLDGPDGGARLQGDIMSVRPLPHGAFEARVRFLDWDVMDELHLARMLHRVSSGWDDWTGLA